MPPRDITGREAGSAATRQAPASLTEAWIALLGLSAVFLFEMLDNSVLNVALPTIGRELRASSTELQWVTGIYSVIFGGAMLVFGAIADRYGRRRVMLIGLLLLAASSLATAFVHESWQLMTVRAAMGVAAAMTTPLSMSLAFRLFDDDSLRVRALTVISTVGLVGLAIGPVIGGFVLAIAPWQVLLLINVPVALLALLAIRSGIAPDAEAGLHRVPLDVLGAGLGTVTIVTALVAPTLFVENGIGAWQPWACAAAAASSAGAFIARQLTAVAPLVDLRLVARPLVASGLAYKAATGIATAGMGYLVTLQLQLAWGWPPPAAALGMLPQVVVLIGAGPFVDRYVKKVGFVNAAWTSAAAVVAGLAAYAALAHFGYVFVAVALVLVALGMRVNGVVAGTNVLRGLPENRTSMGSALVDTATEIASGIGIAVVGTILAALVAGSLTAAHWGSQQAAQFDRATVLSGWALTALAALLVGWGFLRTLHRDGGVPARASE